MEKKNLTWEEKITKSNEYISLFRQTKDIRYKKLAMNIFYPDIEHFCKKNFRQFPQHIPDLIQVLGLFVFNYIENDTFDPSKGVYLLTFMQKGLLSTGRNYIDKMKSPTNFNVKERVSIMNKLKIITQERNLNDIYEAIPIYVDSLGSYSDENKRNAKIYQIKSLMDVTKTSKIPDDEQDEDRIHSELVDDKSDFTVSLENKAKLRSYYHVACMLYERKVLSKLQFKTINITFNAALRGYDYTKSQLAQMLDMSRQNFCRAYNSGQKIVLEYLKKHEELD